MRGGEGRGKEDKEGEEKEEDEEEGEDEDEDLAYHVILAFPDAHHCLILFGSK